MDDELYIVRVFFYESGAPNSNGFRNQAADVNERQHCLRRWGQGRLWQTAVAAYLNTFDSVCWKHSGGQTTDAARNHLYISFGGDFLFYKYFS